MNIRIALRTAALIGAASAIFVFESAGFQSAKPADDAARWAKQAQNVSIIRDNWGIAHVFGKSDADAVFGMIYAQAEDDFNRIEVNYLTNLGWTARAEGESKVIQDLRMELFVDPADLKQKFGQSPAWLQKLMVAWADGLNFYLSKHPGVKPRVITRFEPWMALCFTEGSIGGDIESKINLNNLGAFYAKGTAMAQGQDEEEGYEPEPSGSNGMAIAPSNTASHHPLMLINPHTSFFFRSELEMVSDEGLHAYGAATWGQFFLYQGFNEHTGWMHTSSGVDAVDEYLETVTKKGNGYVYQFGSEERPVTAKEITVQYKDGAGLASKKFTAYYTQNGPVIREQNGKWVAISLMYKPIEALTQSYSRTKTHDYKSYLEVMQLKANSSNNTIFADTDGDIAYFHGNYIPRRDTSFDWTRPVDGSNPKTEYQGLLKVEDTPHLLNPASGWLYNSNNWPWSAAGPSSPKREDYPAYVESGTESARGLHAIRVLKDKKDFTIDSLIAAAYDSYLPWFEKPMPALIKAWDSLPEGNALKAKTAEQIKVLRAWDYRWGVDSVATSLAVFWGDEARRLGGGRRGGAGGAGGVRLSQEEMIAAAPAEGLVQALAAASDKLTADFGKWNTPWGDINRFQRLTSDIVQPFNDSGPSIPVGFTSSTWGSLASFGARAYPGTKKWYGTSGNSFVAVIEFGTEDSRESGYRRRGKRPRGVAAFQR